MRRIAVLRRSDLIRHHRNDDRVFLYGFDLIELNGDDLRRDPLQVRKVTLTSVLAKAGAGIRFNSTWKATVETVFRHACKPRARIHRLEAEGFRLNTGHCLGIPVKSAAGAQRRLIPLRGGQPAACTSSSNPARYRDIVVQTPATKEREMSFRTPVLTAIVAISALTPVQSASAQTYPTKPIHLIVPYPAGGGTDFFARLVGQKMSELVGQPIVVENKPGAATNLGADFVAKAPPDGYTVLLGDVATYAANPSLYKKLPFDPAKDFAPVTLTARFLSVLVANPNKLKVNSVAELIDQAKREPGKIDIAHAGVGNPFHLAAVLFQQAAGIKLNEVPYRGAGPAVQGLLGGDVHMMFVDYATARSHIAAGT